MEQTAKERKTWHDELRDALEGLYYGAASFAAASMVIPAKYAANALANGLIDYQPIYDIDMVVPIAASGWMVCSALNRNKNGMLEGAAVYLAKLGMDINRALTGDYRPLFKDAVFPPVVAVFGAYLNRTVKERENTSKLRAVRKNLKV